MLAERKLAYHLEAEYAKISTDAEVKSALARLNAAAGKPLAVAPSPTLTAALKRLQMLEDTVLSESIELRSDGQLLYVNVHVNGKHQQEMVLDSGASIVCLPAAVAAKLGMKPTEKDPLLTLVLADGREIQGRKMTLKSLRVGKFEVEDVECAVLGEDAVAAQACLGQTFLEAFKYEIDSAAKTLTMVKVGSDGVAKGAK